MTQAVGSRSQMLFWEESTFGETPLTVSANGLDFTNESIQTEVNTFASETIRAHRMIQAVLRGNQRPGGDINCELHSEGMTTLFKHALGSVSTTGSNPYTHVISGASSLPVGLQFEKGFTDIAQYFLYKGCRINTLNMNFPQEGLVNATFSILAREEAVSTAPQDATPTYASVDPIVSFNATLYEGAGLGSAVALGTVVEANFSVENNIREDQFVIGSRLRYNLPEGRRVVTGSMTVFFEDVTLYNKFVNGTQASFKIVCTTAGANTVTFEFPQIQYAGGSPTPVIADDGPIQITLPFQTERYETWDTDIRITFVNTEATI
jgi:hypothetical protein